MKLLLIAMWLWAEEEEEDISPEEAVEEEKGEGKEESADHIQPLPVHFEVEHRNLQKNTHWITIF